jgi:hypothetical protein
MVTSNSKLQTTAIQNAGFIREIIIYSLLTTRREAKTPAVTVAAQATLLNVPLLIHKPIRLLL